MATDEESMVGSAEVSEEGGGRRQKEAEELTSVQDTEWGGVGGGNSGFLEPRDGARKAREKEKLISY